jgi:hypothetical protein
MARRVETITITAEGRDKGKQFIIREMDSFEAEEWGERMLLALVRGGGPEVSEQTVSMGLAGLATLGVGAVGAVQYDEIKPLLKQMMGCVTIPAAIASHFERPVNGQDDIEEVATILRLRKEVLELHLGFSLGSILSFFRRPSPTTATDGNGPDTQTSAPPLA